MRPLDRRMLRGSGNSARSGGRQWKILAPHLNERSEHLNIFVLYCICLFGLSVVLFLFVQACDLEGVHCTL